MFSNNQALNKRRLCELLDSCTREKNVKTFSLLALLTGKLEDGTIKMELIANKQPLSSTAALRKQDLISYYRAKCLGAATIQFVQHCEHPMKNDGPSTLKVHSFPQPQEGSTHDSIGGQTTPSLSKSTTNFQMNDCKTGSRRNKKHRKKKKTAQCTPTSNDLDTKSPAPDFLHETNENLQPEKSTKKKKRKGKKIIIPGLEDGDLNPTLSQTHTIASEALSNDLNHSEYAAADGRETTDLPTKQRQPLLSARVSACPDCVETKSSLSILQDSILGLKEELLHQKATTDLILASNTMSDSKLANHIKNRLSPLEGALLQLKTEFAVLKETQQEQNAILARLVDKFDELPGSKLDKESFEQNVAMHQDNFKTNRHRIESLEIGQENLKLAIREVSKSLNDLNKRNLHACNEPSSKPPPVEESDSTDPRHATYKDVRSLIRPSGRGIPACQPDTEGDHVGVTPVSQPTSKTPKAEDTWAEKVQRDKKSDHKRFTLATKENGRSHKELPPELGPMGTTVINSPKHQGTNHVEPNVESPASEDTTVNRQMSASSQHRKFTVLLIHDENFKNFAPNSFSTQFDVQQFNVTSYEDLEKRNKQLNTVVKRLQPNCIYIHVGINDFMKKRSTVSGAVHDLAEHLLKITKAQICFSLLIPSSNDTEVNDRIRLVNNEVRSNITWFRNSDENSRSRIFTFPNDQVRHQNIFSLNTGFELTDRGEKMLYIRLREGLKKSLRINRASYHNSKLREKHSTNRFSDE